LLALKQLFTAETDYRNAAIKAIAQEMQAEIAAQTPVDFSRLPNLKRPGPFKVSYRTLKLNRDRQTLEGKRILRQFTVDLYLPEGQSQPIPVVVMSHGLGSSPSAFAYLGRHLASHGFAAVIPQHIGSDVTRRQSLLLGIVGSDVNPVEFIDRPLDITYTLDELERLSQSDPTLRGRMNLQQVGAIGHSFNYHLRDPRIKAAFAISPITSVVLGPESLSKIEIPTMLMGGSDDFVASVVQEQIHPFIWLTTPEKYLALAIPSGHTYADNTEEGGAAPQPGSLSYLLSGPDPTLGKEYIRELSLAFMQTYLANRSDYKVFLSAAYAQSVSRKPLNLDLVCSLTPAQLEQAYAGKPPIPIVPPLVAETSPKKQETVLAESAKTGVLRAAVRLNAPPFSFKDESGQPTGFCVDQLKDLTNQLQQQLKRSIRLEVKAEATLENRFQLIRDNQVYIECGPDTIRGNIPGAVFSKPFFVTGTQFLAQKTKQILVSPLNTFKDVRIGVIEGSTTENFIRDRYPKAAITKFDGRTGRSQGIQALAKGSIDIFASDGILLLDEAKKQNLSLNDYTLLPDGPLTCEPYGMLLPANAPQWRDTVNDYINSPAYRQTWQKWFTQGSYSYIFLNLDFCVK